MGIENLIFELFYIMGRVKSRVSQRDRHTQCQSGLYVKNRRSDYWIHYNHTLYIYCQIKHYMNIHETLLDIFHHLYNPTKSVYLKLLGTSIKRSQLSFKARRPQLLRLQYQISITVCTKSSELDTCTSFLYTKCS